MDELYYIILVTLALFGALSISIEEYKTESLLIVLCSFVLFIMNDLVEGISSRGSLGGVFLMAIISMIMTLLFLAFYQTENKKILFKISSVFVLLSGTHILCIMTYIKPIRELSWYHPSTFDLFYWYYGEIQIVLTLYMITLFGKSGIAGFRDVRDRIRMFRLEPSAEHSMGLSNLHVCVSANSSIGYKEREENSQKMEDDKKGVVR